MEENKNIYRLLYSKNNLSLVKFGILK